MLGLINDCVEQLVISKFGLPAWHAIKASAKCTTKDHAFEIHGHYPDSTTVSLVVAASDALGVSVDDVLQLFGGYFLQYTIDRGYDNLLRCQGSTLRLWLSNLNAMHDHLQSSMPKGSFPVFWCENCQEYDGSIILHYYSVRGALLAGVVVGIVKEVAKVYFDVEVKMDRIATQGEPMGEVAGGTSEEKEEGENDSEGGKDGKEVVETKKDGEGSSSKISECTTWRISSVDPKKAHKLRSESLELDDVSVVTATMNRRHRRRSTLKCDNREMTKRSSQGSVVSHCSVYSSAGSTLSTSHSMGNSMGGCPFSGGFSGMTSSNGNSSSGCPFQKLSEEMNQTQQHIEPNTTLRRRSSSEQCLRSNSLHSETNSYCCPKNDSHNENYRKMIRRRSDSERHIRDIQYKLMDEIDAQCNCSDLHDAPHHATKELANAHTYQATHEECNGHAGSAVYNPKRKMESKKRPSSKGGDNGLTPAMVRSLFPYHVMVDKDFKIIQVGNALPEMLFRDYGDLIGLPVGEVLKINKPILAGFDWPTLQRLADQKFFLTPLPFWDERTGARVEAGDVKFKGNIVKISNGGAMFILSPDAENITELSRMGLTMSDLPLHSFQRDVVFLGEHIASEVRTAHKLDRLSKKLEKERNLSNCLLNSMLPVTVAEKLRAGETVQPLLYENVTLFFSDVVGFTRICDAVEPWDVIDMLNKLYTVMDHLASHFNLYKVETIGDAYMCCSGMPTPDENHAQNIANFALAVAECVHLVKSPADGKPLQLRIGIHTGHCMGGVVGTLTPHYCLFGDMVNTTSRHESTGMAGRIQCSKVLYEHLAEFSADSDGPQYEFVPRGYVEMKGKNRCYTYWLERGSKHNIDACPSKIEELKDEVKTVLSKKKWMKRQYFHITRRGSERMADMDSDTVAGDTFSVGMSTTIASTTGQDDGGSTAISSDQDCISQASDHDTVSYSILKKTPWFGIKWDPDKSRIDLVAATHGLLSSMLWKCLEEVEGELPQNKNDLDHELLRFVERVSTLYEAQPFHSWDHACQVVLSSTYLIKEYHKTKLRMGASIDNNPFVRFITVFCALIHDVGHLGIPNAQLEKDEHCLTKVYKDSFLERQSLGVGLGVFIEDFPDLSTLVLRACPEFIHLVTSAVLATDVSSQKRQKEIKKRFERVVVTPDDDVTELEKTQSVIEQILLLADVGHCTQGYEIFTSWNSFFFHECLANFRAGRGADPRPGWFEGQISFIEFYIIPLAERCSSLVPDCEASEGAKRIVSMWKENGEEFTKNLVDQSLKEEQDQIDREPEMENIDSIPKDEIIRIKMGSNMRQKVMKRMSLKRLPIFNQSKKRFSTMNTSSVGSSDDS